MCLRGIYIFLAIWSFPFNQLNAQFTLLNLSSRQGEEIAEGPEKPNFLRADSVSKIYAGHDLKNLNILSYKLTQGLTGEKEKFRSIYRWVCENISYDLKIYNKNKRQRQVLKTDSIALSQWNRSINPLLFNNLLTKKRTVCTGYAYLLRELANLAKIQCEIVHGYGRNFRTNINGESNPNHSWNAVRLDGEWYLCDPTWSSGLYSQDGGTFAHQFEEGYFLTSPELFIKNHYPLDTTRRFMKNGPTLDEFLNGPIIYRSAFKHQIYPLTPMKFRTVIAKGKEVVFKYKSEKVQWPKLCSIHIGSIAKGNLSFPEITEHKKGEFSIKKKFKHKGNYIIHLKFEEDFICTWEIKVT